MRWWLYHDLGARKIEMDLDDLKGEKAMTEAYLRDEDRLDLNSSTSVLSLYQGLACYL